MPVELRKRKPREAPPPPPPKRTNKGGRGAKVKQAAKKVEEEKVAEKEPEKEEEEIAEEVEEKVEEKAEEKPKDEKKKSGPLEVGDVIDLEDFGGEVETNDGETTTLKKLVDESKAGVVLFTYPKASTPGCKFHHPSHHFHPTHRTHALAPPTLSLIIPRHQASMLLPRRIHTPHRRRSHHLRP